MMEKYPILYCQRNKSEMETCMCWGIEADEGWYEKINELSALLEELNHKFKIYGVRIQADQVKSKYASLCFYYSIIMERNVFFKTILFPFNSVINFIDNHFEFKFEKIEDKPAYTEEIWEEISKEDYDNKKTPWIKNDYGYKFKEENNKYYRNGCIYHNAEIHFELKNHKIINKIKLIFQKIKSIIERIPFSKHKRENADLLEKITRGIIQEYENKCWNTCEWCGHYDNLGIDIITTTGWMTRICRDCAEQYEDNKVKKFDEIHNRIYHPRIVNFDTCYNFLNKFDNHKFKFNNLLFNSIWSAYYYNLFNSSNNLEIQKLSDFFSYGDKATPEYYYNIGKKLLEYYRINDDNNLMEKIIEAKYSGCIKNKLIKTKNKSFTYFNYNCDSYWGVCLCDKCRDTIDSYNYLGKIIEKVRNNYVIEEKKVKDGNGNIKK